MVDENGSNGKKTNIYIRIFFWTSYKNNIRKKRRERKPRYPPIHAIVVIRSWFWRLKTAHYFNRKSFRSFFSFSICVVEALCAYEKYPKLISRDLLHLCVVCVCVPCADIHPLNRIYLFSIHSNWFVADFILFFSLLLSMHPVHAYELLNFLKKKKKTRINKKVKCPTVC